MDKLIVNFLRFDTLEKSNKCKMAIYDNCDEQTHAYKLMRLQKIDPIDGTNIDEDTCFKYNYIWDSFTGDLLYDNETLVEDPFGPLCFSPCNIVKTIYYRRLDNIWVKTNNNNDYDNDYYYGDNVGIGNNFEITGRGIYKERHLFRLPVVDCYLPKNHNAMMVTMGPLLTNDDVLLIDNLITRHWIEIDQEINKIYEKIKSLVNLKKIYELIINSDPISSFSQEYIESIGLDYILATAQNNPNIYLHHMAVNMLKEME